MLSVFVSFRNDMMGHHQTYFSLKTFTLLYVELRKCVLTSNVAGESEADLSSSWCSLVFNFVPLLVVPSFTTPLFPG